MVDIKTLTSIEQMILDELGLIETLIGGVCVCLSRLVAVALKGGEIYKRFSWLMFCVKTFRCKDDILWT